MQTTITKYHRLIEAATAAGFEISTSEDDDGFCLLDIERDRRLVYICVVPNKRDQVRYYNRDTGEDFRISIAHALQLITNSI